MEAVKLNNEMVKPNPSAAGFFYRRIGGTLFEVRVYTGLGYAERAMMHLGYCISEQ